MTGRVDRTAAARRWWAAPYQLHPAPTSNLAPRHSRPPGMCLADVTTHLSGESECVHDCVPSRAACRLALRLRGRTSEGHERDPQPRRLTSASPDERGV